MNSGMLTIRGAGTERRMNVDLIVAYDADVKKAEKSITEVLSRAEGVVTEPPPNVYVTDFAPEGVKITINFWLNTLEARPRVVFDNAACEIISSLLNAGIEPYPPDSVIVKESPTTDPTERAQNASKGR